MRKLLYLLLGIYSVTLFSQEKEVELLKSQNGNEITYYAKSNIREVITVEMNLEGKGFTTSVPLPISVELRSYEKKEVVKITLDQSGSSYNVSYKTIKGKKPAGAKSSFVSNEDLDELTKKHEKGIVVFSKDGCGKCTFTKNFLNDKKLPYHELNLSNSLNMEFLSKKLSAAGFSGGSFQTPVIMIDGKVHYNMDLKPFLEGIKY
jgi:glutaredoxin